MPLTITVPEPLAEKLQSRAQAENLPVDELASRLLESGMQRPLVPQPWRATNQRRVALIDKQFSGGLSDQEQAELQHLQELADQQLEELDALMLTDVGRMEAKVAEIRKTPR